MKTRIKIYVVAGILLMFSFCLLPVNAANLTASSNQPSVYFNDTDKAGIKEWSIDGFAEEFLLFNHNTSKWLLWFDDDAEMRLQMSATTFNIRDQNTFSIVSVHRDAPLSLDILSNGDVSLAGGDVFIDTSSDRLGIGTSTPGDDLEIQSTTPGIWFDDESSNSTDWFVGNSNNDFEFHTSFNGTGGPVSTQIMTLDAETGFVGIGAHTPTTPLHVQRNNGTAQILVEEANVSKAARTLFEIKNNGNPEFRMSNTGNGNSWLFSAGLRFVVKNNAGDWVSRVDANGNMEITGALTTTGGTCGGGGCDLLFHPDTKIESIEEHAASMWANSYLPAVGPTKENQPFNLTEKTGGMLNELEKAHVYIEQLNKQLSEQHSSIEEQDQLIAELKTGHKQLLSAYHTQKTELEKLDQLEQMVNHLIQSQAGKSVYTSLK